MRYLIFYIFILIIPFSAHAQEYVTGRISSMDIKKQTLSLTPFSCRQKCMGSIFVKSRQKFDKKDFEPGDTITASGYFHGENEFEAVSLTKFNSDDPTGIRSRLKHHRGRGRHHMHRHNYE